MRTISCLGILLGLMVFSLFAAGASRAAEQPAGDLTPVPPMVRALATNGNPYQFRNYNNGGAMSLSADGKWLLMTSNGLMLWSLSDHPQGQGQPRMFDTGQINMFNSAGALSPDGKTAAVVPMFHNMDMAVRLFDAKTGRQIREIDNDQQILALTFSPDGQHLAVATQQNIELWKAEDGEEVRVLSGGVNGNSRLLTFSPDGKMIATLGNEPDTVHIWEVASGKERATVHLGPQPTPQPAGRRVRIRVVLPGNNLNNNPILSLAFSTDCRQLAIGQQNSGIHLWDLQANRELPPLTGSSGQITAMVFASNGKELIAVDSEGSRLSWRTDVLRRNSNVRLTPLDDADFADLWNDLAEPDLFRVYRARRHLVADPKRAVPLLSRHLEPVPAGDTARIQQLIKDLSSPNAGTRRKAMTELRTKHGEAGLGALMQVAGGGNAVMGGGAAMGGMMKMGGGGGSQAAMVLLQKLQSQYNTSERQRDVAAVHVLEELGTPEAKATLAKLSKGAEGVELTTASKAALDRLAAGKERPRHSSTPEQLWTELGSDDAARAYQAQCGLAAAPEQAVTLLRKELKPVAVIEAKEIAALLDNLNSDDFRVREEATQSLGKIGEQALPAMKTALDNGVSLEARKRLERLVEQTASQSAAPLLRSLRAVEVLEHLRTAEAKNVLLALAGGAPHARITREAKESLQRLAQR